MKKAEFRTEMSSRAMKHIRAIMETEGLKLQVRTEETALGDTVIVASGDSISVMILRDIFNVVK